MLRDRNARIGELVAKRDRQRENPLPDGDGGDDAVDEPFVLASRTAHSDEAVSENSAFEVTLEVTTDERGHLAAGVAPLASASQSLACDDVLGLGRPQSRKSALFSRTGTYSSVT